jgi:hypothetical protein
MSNDVFADIGTRMIAARRNLLEEVRPPELPRRQLPVAASMPKAAFQPVDKLDSAAKLQAELVRQRRRHAPFMKDLAPKLPSLRIAQRLEDFQWRLETEADRADFLHPITGAGEWKRIKVPHFGGPIGRTVAYYRTPFTVTRAMLDKGAIFVKFGAVDYKAHVFVNGHYLGSHEGFFAPFEFECLAAVKEGENILLVKVENDAIYLSNAGWGQKEEGDKLYAATNLGWDDPELGWWHCPPGFGIYQDVFVEARAPLHLADLYVRPLPDEERAEAWIEVWNKERYNRAVSVEVSVFGQNFRHIAFDNLAGQAFGDGRLADASFANQQRIVLAPPAQRLDDALEFLVTADQRVDLALQRQSVEVDRVLLQRAGFGFFTVGFNFALGSGLGLLWHLADAMRDVIHYIQAGDALFLQEIHRVRILFAIDRDQHVGAIDFLLARGLDMQDGALDDALESERRLRVDVVLAGNGRRMLVDEIGEVLAQRIGLGTAGAQRLGGGRIVDQCQQ